MSYLWYNSVMKTQVIPAEDLLAIIDEKEREIARKDQRITELEQHMQWLVSQIKLAKNKQFGSSSEKSDDNSQLSVFNEAESLADMTIPEPELTEVKSHYRKRTRLTTDKLPDDIPVEIIEHEVPEEQRICSCCGSMLHADETSLNVLKEPGKQSQGKKKLHVAVPDKWGSGT